MATRGERGACPASLGTSDRVVALEDEPARERPETGGLAHREDPSFGGMDEVIGETHERGSRTDGKRGRPP